MSVDYQTEEQNQKQQTRDGQGGFVAVLHTLEEKFYGPDMNLTGPALKILLYLRHRALRDWTTKKRIPKHEIIKATGLQKRAVERALVSLEKEKYILVIRTKVGKIWQDNIYELHPEMYGTDYIYRPEKPSFKVIYGSKGHKSNPENNPQGNGSYPQSDDLPSNMTAGEPTNSPAGVPTNVTVGNEPNYMESKTNSLSKNPLKEPFKKTLSEIHDFQSIEAERAAAKEAKEMLGKMMGFGFKSF